MSTEALGLSQSLNMPGGINYYSAAADIDPYMSIMGPEFNEYMFDGLTASAPSMYKQALTTSITANEREQLQPLIDNLGKWRIFGKRVAENDAVRNILNYRDEITGQSKPLALIYAYSAEKGGTKQPILPGQEINFTDLNDPDLLIRQSSGPLSFFGVARWTGVHDSLANAAVEMRNGELAAMLIKQTGDGIGSDEQGIKKLLVDSKEGMSDGEYGIFIADTAMAYEKMYGESLDDYIRTQYSPLGIAGAVSGAIAGAVLGHGLLSIPLAIVGAGVGAVAGGMLGESIPLPTSGKSQKLIDTINDALLRANRPNMDMFSMLY